MINFESLSNKKFALTLMKELIKQNALSDKDINILTNEDECKRLFDCSKFAILSEVSRFGELNEEDYCDKSGRSRYYQEKVLIGNKAYIVTNHWYGPNKSMKDNRTLFLKWAKGKVSL